ncbi:MAG: anaerobic glycerol-3-phosphate dehydrogenase subunit GlpB [Candidatus Thorarchaeota archaeon]
MDFDCDLVVIGGGMAGLVAGSIAAESDFDVVALRKGQSATAYSSGAIDVAGYMPESCFPFSSPIEGMISLAGTHAFHPYGFLEDVSSAVREESNQSNYRIAEAISYLKNRLQKSPAALHGSLNNNFEAITMLGTTKPTCLVQKGMNPGNLMSDSDSCLLFAGFSGHQDFDAEVAARTFVDNQLSGQIPPQKVAHCELSVSPHGSKQNISSIGLARHFDHGGDGLEPMLNELTHEAESVGATHIAFPSVLGLKHPHKIRRNMEEATDATVLELLALPPSVPGMRLQRSLDEMFKKSGGSLMIGYECKPKSFEESNLRSIEISGPARSLSIETKAIVLATGKFIGGGIAGDKDGLSETVFDIPVVTEKYESASHTPPRELTKRVAVSEEGHALYGCGVPVDSSLKPVGRNGKPVGKNFFCAGSVIAGYRYPTEKSGLGVALLSGYVAGKQVAQYLEGAE